MRCATVLLSLTCILVPLGCAVRQTSYATKPTPEERAVAVDPQAQTLAKNNNEFALDLFGRLSTNDGNLAFSPASISTALAMTYAGARRETASQMAKTLHFTLPVKELHPAFGKLTEHLIGKSPTTSQLAIANALWGQAQATYRPEFIQVLRANYGAGFREVDFKTATDKSRLTINAWVEEQTRNKIRELLQPDDVTPQTRLVLTNAVYFKADWQQPFPKEQTKEGAFHLSAKEIVNVPLMGQDQTAPYFEDDSVQVLELPYHGGKFAMLLVLPRKVDGLADVTKGLTEARIGDWVGQLKPDAVDITLPRFKVASRFQLAETLSQMGMPLAFSEHADFSGLDGEQSLRISRVIHQAVIEVDEKGTEAAAATAVTMEESAPPSFCADHPFLIFLRDRPTGSIVFAGRVSDPR